MIQTTSERKRAFLIVFVPTVIAVIGAAFMWSLPSLGTNAFVGAVAILLLPLSISVGLFVVAVEIFGSSLNTAIPLSEWEASPKTFGQILSFICLIIIVAGSLDYWKMLAHVTYPELWGLIIGLLVGGGACHFIQLLRSVI